MNYEHLFFAFVTLWLCGLTWRAWVHRKAIRGLIKLRKDVEAIEEHVTRPRLVGRG